jgi:hypothetical protein
LKVREILLLLLTGGSIGVLCVGSLPIQYCHCLHNLESARPSSDHDQPACLP